MSNKCFVRVELGFAYFQEIPLPSTLLIQDEDRSKEILLISNNNEYKVSGFVNKDWTHVRIGGNNWYEFVKAHKLVLNQGLYFIVRELGIMNVFVFDKNNVLSNSPTPNMSWNYSNNIKVQMVLPVGLSSCITEDHADNFGYFSNWSVVYGECTYINQIAYSPHKNAARLVVSGYQWDKLLKDHANMTVPFEFWRRHRSILTKNLVVIYTNAMMYNMELHKSYNPLHYGKKVSQLKIVRNWNTLMLDNQFLKGSVLKFMLDVESVHPRKNDVTFSISEIS
ncbi:OLC1v1021749C1 [Oldenlandia corymbosa var. corymbosa]|uniref:OLC1v1021749C1 n=1 Tax=Oldenlandia corymbosa var. corymbosa TaxID=529605 RepID=A0AAV1BYK8_OLDCO|nr:OLC1v1021749C1 [Oldenlandia corymbosa var. corymbosa]